MTNVRSRRDSAWARISFALPGQLVSPMTIMTFVMELPNSAITSRTRKNVGIIRNALMLSEMTISVFPPKKPAMPPTRMPRMAEIMDEMTATFSEVLVPSMIME